MTTEPTPTARDRLDEALQWRGHSEDKIVEVETTKVQLLIFAIGPSLLALPARALTEILPSSPIYFVPGCPPVIEGVINLRGDIVSVIRLGGLLGLEHAPASRATAILLGRGRDRAGEPIQSGLRVDRVIDVLALPESSIQPPPESLAAPLQGVATGLFIHGEASVILLDLDAILARFLEPAG
ncbi:MAG: purine-binding chemotaxis protein CheW [Sphingobacteriia bacterium]|nr:purine-binding chemotaxis protein CheW [Sphingobacteriia bacterium]NCC39810.1 purine-binding chemotaxis protein CheW [Gammaproteobacteria bacterium]